MLEEIRDLGFEYAELSHGIRLSLVPGIFEAFEAGVIKISTLHNFCPLPIGCNHANPNVFKFSSTNPRERDNAYKHSMKTIEMADRLGAKLIVLHMGEIDMRNYTDKLIDLLEAGKQDTPKYQKLCQAAEIKREKKKTKYCEEDTSVENDEGISASEACPVTCGTCPTDSDCTDDETWFTKKSKNTCAEYVAKKIKLCKEKTTDEDGVSSLEACKLTCGQC